MRAALAACLFAAPASAQQKVGFIPGLNESPFVWYYPAVAVAANHGFTAEFATGLSTMASFETQTGQLEANSWINSSAIRRGAMTSL